MCGVECRWCVGRDCQIRVSCEITAACDGRDCWTWIREDVGVGAVFDVGALRYGGRCCDGM